jgi:hypothetical protein
MTPEQEKKRADLQRKQELAAGRLQRIVDTLSDAAVLRHLESRPPEDESHLITVYEETLNRMDELIDEEERLLQEAGILPSWKD